MKLAVGLKITALVLMALAALFFSFMGIGEMVGGDLSGAMHLPPVALIALMMWFGWKKPFPGGAAMLGMGLLISIFILIATSKSDSLIAVLLMGGPFVIPGILFMTASLLENPHRLRHI